MMNSMGMKKLQKEYYLRLVHLLVVMLMTQLSQISTITGEIARLIVHIVNRLYIRLLNQLIDHIYANFRMG